MSEEQRASERASEQTLCAFLHNSAGGPLFPFLSPPPFQPPLFFFQNSLSLSLPFLLSLSLSLIQDMDKLAVGPLVNPHRVSLSYPVAQNLASIAEALSKPVSEVTVEKI